VRKVIVVCLGKNAST